MLKVVILGYLPEDIKSIRGGVEAVVKNLLEGFSSKEIEIHVFSLDSRIVVPKITQFSSNITIHHFPFGKIKSIKLEMLFHGRKVLRKFLSEIKPDIIHAQGNGSNLLLLKGLDYSRIVITPHASLKDEIQNIRSLKWKFNHLINIFIEKKYLTRTGNIIFISKYIQNELFKNHSRFKIHNSALIYNPVDAAYFNCKEESQKNNLNIVYLGAIIHRKGLALLLDAFSFVNSKRKDKIILHVIGGNTEEEYKDIISKKISEFNLADDVIFHGWLKQDEIIEIFNSACVFVMPSYHENLPVSLIEAMSAGLVIIASKVGGIPEIVTEGFNGLLFNSNDITSLIAALEKVIADKELRIRLSGNGRSFALRNFHPAEIGQKTIEYYSSLLP
jgi:glycosyltransferase involved in cell wall biosynthesis